jgi:hypothetical protein|tara:strand:- start:509 stop:715 length:207 start_codon:yes stop_codon:yes gene_type:complete
MKVKDIGDNVGEYAGQYVEINFITGEKLVFTSLEQAKSYIIGQRIVPMDEGRLVEDRLVIQAYREKNM